MIGICAEPLPSWGGSAQLWSGNFQNCSCSFATGIIHTRMIELLAYFKNELPLINGFLDEETSKLEGLVKDVARHGAACAGKEDSPGADDSFRPRTGLRKR